MLMNQFFVSAIAEKVSASTSLHLRNRLRCPIRRRLSHNNGIL
jgi:hypothetical protein